MTMTHSCGWNRGVTDDFVALLSRLEGVECVEWRPSHGEPSVARRGRRVPERELRKTRPGRERHRWTDPRGSGTLWVFVDAEVHANALRLESLGALLGGASIPAFDAPTATSERLHDLAHLVHRARLELESESSDGLRAAREALQQFEAEAAEQRSSVEATPLRGLVEREFRNACASVSSADRAELALDVDGGIVTRLSTRLLGRAIRNLLVNALQASPRGARVHVAASRIGSEVRLRVRDDGRGVTRGEAQLLSRAAASHVRGRGLGLRSLADCVRLLGIEMRFDSARTAGTAVHLCWNEPDAKPTIGLVSACPNFFARVAAERGAEGGQVVWARTGEEFASRTDVAQLDSLLIARGTPGIADLVAESRRARVPVRLMGFVDDLRSGA